MTCGIVANLCEQSATCRDYLNRHEQRTAKGVGSKHKDPRKTRSSGSAKDDCGKGDPRTLCANLTHAVIDFLLAAGLQSEDTCLAGGDEQISESANKQDTVLTEDLILGGYMCILLGCTIIENPVNAAVIGQILRDRAPAHDGGADDEEKGATGCAAPLIRVICGFLNFQVRARLN